MSSNLSYTASYIAVKFYGLTLNPKIASQFDPFLLKFYADVVSYLPDHLSWNKNALKSRVWRNFFVRWEELLLPGDLMHIISRKFYIQKILDMNLKEGDFEQLVILGSGFDHNGVLYSKQGIPVFEIDTLDMIYHKQKMLDRYEYNQDDLTLCSIDPADQDIFEVLSLTESFDPDKKTLFLAEGFFDYLSLESVRSILESIKSFSSSFKIVSTFFDLDELNFFHRFMFTSGVAMVGETLKLPLDRNEFIELLKEYEVETSSQLSYKEMEVNLVHRMNLEIKLPVLKGFYIIESAFDK